MRIGLIQKFLALESLSGIILFIMAVVAMLWANSPFAFIHQQFIHTFLFWINEVLMALFFLLVGLELKRGFLAGQLSRFSQIALPATAALGGMLIPAGIYWLINRHDPIAINGWATPVATDIAFALGVLSLFGRRIPVALKLFLLALAIFDDIGAIIIIGIYYSHGLAGIWLLQSAGLLLLLFLFNFLGMRSLLIYLLLGIGLWIGLFKAGVHPTLAGVLLALTIPGTMDNRGSPLHRLETKLHPWVAYFIMPLFALANAGFSLTNLSINTLTSGVVLGIILGLFIGKQIGVGGGAWLFIKLGLAKLPDKSNWLELYGVALLCGIGFTMSLFLGTLSFANQDLLLAQVRFGVAVGSILSALTGAVVLLIAFSRKRRRIID